VRAFSRLVCEPGKPIVRCAVGIFSIDRDQSSGGALIDCSYRVSRYLEPSVRYHPLTSSPRDFEPEVFAFALAYAEKSSKNQARDAILSPCPRENSARWNLVPRLAYIDDVVAFKMRDSALVPGIRRLLGPQFFPGGWERCGNYCPISSIEVILQSPRLVGTTRRRSTDFPRICRDPSWRLQETGCSTT
jgi:hypothetical protein